MKYSFYNDYSEGVHPEILQYIADHNGCQQPGYGLDEHSKLAESRIKATFRLPNAEVHFIPNGTIANVIGLASILKPYEGIISPDSGHINTHEAGAVEATGHKIIWVKTNDGRLTPDLIDEALARYEDEHTVVPKVIYLTQATEWGTTYSLNELETVIAHARSKDLYVFVDGARLAMGLAGNMSAQEFGSLNIDMFYIGGTKNGGIYGEAMVINNPSLQPYFRNHMKQRGGLMAKGSFMGLQFTRMFDADNLWLQTAEHANKQASKLYEGLKDLGIMFDLETGTNQIFPILDNRVIETLKTDYGFYEWQKVDEQYTKIRLVCSWATTDEAVEMFLQDAAQALS